MNDIEKQITEVLDSMSLILDSHESSAEIVEIKGNRVVIQMIGQCAECDINCLEEAIYQKLPDIDLIFQ
jgi:Fe-S cluster biogenesis protein NfuA